MFVDKSDYIRSASQMRAFLAATILIGSVNGYAQPCAKGPYELAKKFEGTWQEFTVTDAGEKLDGTLSTNFELNGCVIRQRFESADKSFSFVSFGYVERSSNQWYETYALSNGKVRGYRWTTDGETIFHELISGDDAEGRPMRLRITFVNKDFYQVIQERYEGNQWVKGQRTNTRRVQ